MAADFGPAVGVSLLFALFGVCSAGTYCQQEYNSVGYSRTVYCTYGCCNGDSTHLTLCCPIPTWVVLVALAGSGLVLLLVLVVTLVLCRAYRRRRLMEEVLQQQQASQISAGRADHRPPSYDVAFTQGGSYLSHSLPALDTCPDFYPPDVRMDLPPPSYEEVTRSDGIVNKAFEKN